MSNMKKLIFIIILVFSFSSANGNPFDILHNNEPDFVVTNIFQQTNTNNIALTVCNYGNTMDQN